MEEPIFRDTLDTYYKPSDYQGREVSVRNDVILDASLDMDTRLKRCMAMDAGDIVPASANERHAYAIRLGIVSYDKIKPDFVCLDNHAYADYQVANQHFDSMGKALHCAKSIYMALDGDIRVDIHAHDATHACHHVGYIQGKVVQHLTKPPKHELKTMLVLPLHRYFIYGVLCS